MAKKSMILKQQAEAIIKVFPKRDTISIVLFSGRPNFRWLDSGMFISAKNKHGNASNIYVMTETSFKLFGTEKTKKQEV